MDGLSVSCFPFLAVGLSRGGFGIRAIRSFDTAARLLLHCRGIEVGHLALARPVPAGEVIEIPIDRLPHVPLPTELRLSTALDGPDLVAPWPIENAAAALSLLGPPEMRVEDLRMDHGVLRGTGREDRNGLIDPVLFARINGTGARMVSVEPPVGLPEGGCAFRFALPIRPGDLSDAGLSVELYMIGQDAPVARFGWVCSGVGETERSLAELETRLRQMEEEQAATQRGLQEMLRRQLALQQERVDSFIAAAATLLLDRLACAPGQEEDALRALLDSAGPARIGQTAVDLNASQVRVSVEDGVFGAGWHQPELYPTGSFRWMSARGLLLNPAPERRLAGVTLEICHLYEAAAPVLTATIDDVAAEVTATPDLHGGFRLRIEPADGPRPARLLRLASLTGGCPAETAGSSDRRVLSLAVSRAVFDYAD